MRGEERLIVALDSPSTEEAEKIFRELSGSVKFFKVGLELFIAGGKSSVEMLRFSGKEVFLDLKLHDIPNTVGRASKAICGMDISMFTVHASGGALMLKAAAEASSSSLKKPLVLAVTLLTHLEEQVLREQLGVSRNVEQHVLSLASTAVESGAGGIVCSPREISAIRGKFGSGTVIVTPGIRPDGAEAGDQRRTCSPGTAVKLGADYIVVGRPITAAPERKKAAERILRSIDGL